MGRAMLNVTGERLGEGGRLGSRTRASPKRQTDKTRTVLLSDHFLTTPHGDGELGSVWLLVKQGLTAMPDSHAYTLPVPGLTDHSILRARLREAAMEGILFG